MRTGIFALGLLASAAFLLHPQVRTLLRPEAVATRVAAWGLLAPLAYVLATAVAAMLWIPRTPMGMAAGVLFGPWTGGAWALVGALAGAVLNYAWARGTLAHPGAPAWARELSQRKQRLVFMARRHGFGLVALGHLSPVGNYQVINYLAGAVAMPVGRYVAASAVGMAPGSLLYAHLGAGLAQGDGARTGLSLGSLVAFLLGTSWVLVRWGREARDASL